MKILITGYKGFIGKNLYHYLQTKGYQVEGFDWFDKIIPNLQPFDVEFFPLKVDLVNQLRVFLRHLVYRFFVSPLIATLAIDVFVLPNLLLIF